MDKSAGSSSEDPEKLDTLDLRLKRKERHVRILSQPDVEEVETEYSKPRRKSELHPLTSRSHAEPVTGAEAGKKTTGGLAMYCFKLTLTSLTYSISLY